MAEPRDTIPFGTSSTPATVERHEPPTVTPVGNLNDDLERVRPVSIPLPGETRPAATIDTSNKFLVARNGRGILVMAFPVLAMPINDEHAINLAAWLVAMTEDGGGPRFAAVLRAIKNT